MHLHPMTGLIGRNTWAHTTCTCTCMVTNIATSSCVSGVSEWVSDCVRVGGVGGLTYSSRASYRRGWLAASRCGQSHVIPPPTCNEQGKSPRHITVSVYIYNIVDLSTCKSDWGTWDAWSNAPKLHILTSILVKAYTYKCMYPHSWRIDCGW